MPYVKVMDIGKNGTFGSSVDGVSLCTEVQNRTLNIPSSVPSFWNRTWNNIKSVGKYIKNLCPFYTTQSAIVTPPPGSSMHCRCAGSCHEKPHHKSDQKKQE